MIENDWLLREWKIVKHSCWYITIRYKHEHRKSFVHTLVSTFYRRICRCNTNEILIEDNIFSSLFFKTYFNNIFALQFFFFIEFYRNSINRNLLLDFNVKFNCFSKLNGCYSFETFVIFNSNSNSILLADQQILIRFLSWNTFPVLSYQLSKVLCVKLYQLLLFFFIQNQIRYINPNMTVDQFYFCNFSILISTMQNSARTGQFVMKKSEQMKWIKCFPSHSNSHRFFHFSSFFPFDAELSILGTQWMLLFFFRCWCAHQHGNRNVIKNLSWCLLLLSQFFHPFYRFS